MRIDQSALIAELLEVTHKVIESAKLLKTHDQMLLATPPTEGAWSALQCVEHLNLYGDFYLHEIERRIIASQKLVQPPQGFTSGWLGGWFVEQMKPSPTMKPMKAPRDKVVDATQVSHQAIDRFLRQQDRMQALLLQARNTDLNKVRTSISISRIIQLKLGDTFAVVVYHNQRHLAQAQNAVNALRGIS
jgi:hypothetical protein